MFDTSMYYIYHICIYVNKKVDIHGSYLSFQNQIFKIHLIKTLLTVKTHRGTDYSTNLIIFFILFQEKKKQNQSLE